MVSFKSKIIFSKKGMLLYASFWAKEHVILPRGRMGSRRKDTGEEWDWSYIIYKVCFQHHDPVALMPHGSGDKIFKKLHAPIE